MNQSINTNNRSLAQLRNHMGNKHQILKMYNEWKWLGRITEDQYRKIDLTSLMNDRLFYRDFVVDRNKDVTAQGRIFDGISDDTLYELLMGGNYSWEEIDAMSTEAKEEMLQEINSSMEA